MTSETTRPMRIALLFMLTNQSGYKVHVTCRQHRTITFSAGYDRGHLAKYFCEITSN